MIYYNMKYIIYKIQINDYIYIGSTKQFAVRKATHKRCCNNGRDIFVYNTIRENGGWDCCSMVPIREVEVETKLQARIIEEEERVKYNAQMNAIRVYRTEEERIADNKEQKVLYRQSEAGKAKYKLWVEANRETINEYHRKWREAKKAEQSSKPNV